MRILHVTLGFYPAEGWGGPVKVVHLNGRELARRGHQVTVCCTNLLNKKQTIRPGTFEDEIDGLRVVYFETWRWPWWPGTLGPIWLPGLPGYLAREVSTYDVVHLNGYRSPMMLAAVRAARRAGVPVVTQPHGTLPVIMNSFQVKRAYDWLLGRGELDGIAALIALQESEKQQALAHGVPAERIVIIPNGVDYRDRRQMPERASFRRRFGLAADRPLILFLARLSKTKGADMLIEAFARLQHSAAQLAIVGPDDGQLAEVKRLIDKYGLGGRVTLTGLLTGSAVTAAHQDADLFVLPSRSDAFPLALVEACLAGTPMVITDRCEIANLVRDRVADVVPFDPDSFAAAIDRLLADRQRYERYRQNTQAMIADTFSIEAVVDCLEALYERVVAEAHASQTTALHHLPLEE